MSKKSKLIYFLITTLFFIFIDMYFTKLLLENVGMLSSNPILEIISVQNSGAAFSILQDSRCFLVVFSIFALSFIVYNILRYVETLSSIAIFWASILTSGIFCNMWERFSLGYVNDFFALKIIDFPVFNISDILINVSVVAIVVIIIKYNYSKNNEDNN